MNTNPKQIVKKPITGSLHHYVNLIFFAQSYNLELVDTLYTFTILDFRDFVFFQNDEEHVKVKENYFNSVIRFRNKKTKQEYYAFCFLQIEDLQTSICGNVILLFLVNAEFVKDINKLIEDFDRFSKFMKLRNDKLTMQGFAFLAHNLFLLDKVFKTHHGFENGIREFFDLEKLLGVNYHIPIVELYDFRSLEFTNHEKDLNVTEEIENVLQNIYEKTIHFIDFHQEGLQIVFKEVCLSFIEYAEQSCNRIKITSYPLPQNLQKKLFVYEALKKYYEKISYLSMLSKFRTGRLETGKVP